MLVLSRKEGECIRIGDDIIIQVVEIRDKCPRQDRVRLGITAPDHIAIHRQEVYDAIKREGGQ